MRKYILNSSGNNTDVILNTRFNASTNGGQFVFTNENKDVVTGKTVVDSAIIYEQNRDDSGYRTTVIKTWLSRSQIVEMYEKIMEIESTVTDIPLKEYQDTDYLPF